MPCGLPYAPIISETKAGRQFCRKLAVKPMAIAKYGMARIFVKADNACRFDPERYLVKSWKP